ncbi:MULTISPECIES: peptidoglycan recognition protein family protein [Streptomyces]|uniref:peptidoglycan recognition protein family protein n=1 Tax=Streptomyces TaxID=1883 RepID=UPI00081B3F20|nr:MULTISPECIES: peptidoglycan recognition protein [unclassified Streptomyces]MYQ54468.1 N-acetylmuramoyl-L-alanine amidase [Streptomyces sp. SID4941]SCE23788.1 N-acetylmuramoyl-L-alanine amidase [Streptomyces sp. PalvLS-984]SDC71121.1 N-acetylmuramoyl-L-alanine amidase [Streptomyces sp. AmelKG-A3]
MWLRRTALAAAVVPLALLVFRDAPVRFLAPERASAKPAVPAAPRPAIVGRAQWHADESLVKEHASYTGEVNAVFVHHTGHPNDYDCADVPRMLRAMEEDHVRGEGWDDIGYNFVVDRCGTIYEGRGGGIGRSVRGAHTTGFNAHSVGIAAIGDFAPGVPVPKALIEGIAKVGAWKLRPGIDPRGTVRMVSSNDDSLFHRGQVVHLHVVSGHRDTFETSCPGDALYAQLPAVREEMARLRTPRR